MIRRRETDGGSCYGKHAPGAFGVQLYLLPGGNDVAILTAERQGAIRADLARSGVGFEIFAAGENLSHGLRDDLSREDDRTKESLVRKLIARSCGQMVSAHQDPGAISSVAEGGDLP